MPYSCINGGRHLIHHELQFLELAYKGWGQQTAVNHADRLQHRLSFSFMEWRPCSYSLEIRSPVSLFLHGTESAQAVPT